MGSFAGIPTIDYDEEPREKKWQKIQSPYIVLVLAFYLLLAYLTQLTNDIVSPVIKDSEIPINNTDKFSEESAREYLKIILGDGPRVAGTKYHLEKTKDLKSLLDDIASKSTLKVYTDWQIASGDYSLEYNMSYVNWYQNISNTVALLEGESGFHQNGTTKSSLLINCHYDSVPFALGASDNGIFCGAMVESLVRLSRRKNKLKNNIIFLFNGAEENPMQGSHGFISHKWFKGVSHFINLDSAGTNGRPSVFQVSDTRLLDAYKHTKLPTAQSMGQAVFDSGIIPSDTDYRIWRTYGHIEGVDIAFTRWGHVYHTRNDVTRHVQPGVIQCAGDMLLDLTIRLAGQTLGNDQPASIHPVYYDYLGLFLVTYSESTAFIIDSIICVLAVLSVLYYLWIVGFRWSSVRELLWSVCGRILSLVVAVTVVAACLFLMVATTIQIRYLSYPWIIPVIYWIPYLIAASSTSQVFDAWRSSKVSQSRNTRAIQAAVASRIVLLAPVVILLFLPTGNFRYGLTVPLGFMSVTSFVSLTSLLCWRLTAWQQLLQDMFLSIPSVMFIYSLSTRFLSLLVPIMGRFPNGEPDYIIGWISVGLCVLTSLQVAGMELLFSRKQWWLVATVLSIISGVVMFLPLGPYTSDVAVQRHNWIHTQISTYDYNNTLTDRISGVIITKWDANNILSAKEMLKGSNLREISVSHYCENHPYCNMPLYRPRTGGKAISQSLFVEMDPPNTFENSFQLTNKTCLEETCVLSFTMTGPTHSSLYITPKENIKLISWSLSSKPKATIKHKSLPVYTVTHSMGTYSGRVGSTEFSLTLLVPLYLQNGSTINISHSAFKIQAPDEQTHKFRQLIQSAPEYFNIAPTLCFKNNYEF